MPYYSDFDYVFTGRVNTYDYLWRAACSRRQHIPSGMMFSSLPLAPSCAPYVAPPETASTLPYNVASEFPFQCRPLRIDITTWFRSGLSFKRPFLRWLSGTTITSDTSLPHLTAFDREFTISRFIM